MTLPIYSLLIVEQSLAVREQYQRDLQTNSSFNCQWFAVTSIAAGVDLCRTNTIDVVLLGESLANSKGLTFLEALSDCRQIGRPSVVMIAATGDISIAVRAIKLGAEDYLIKSELTPERLQLVVQSAVETARSQQQADRVQISVDIDLQAAHQQAQEAREQLKIGMQVAGVGLARFDYDTDRVTLAPEAAAIYGFSADVLEVSRAQLHATFHPDERAELLEIIKQVVEDSEGPGWFARDHRIVWPNGEVHWLSVHKQVFFDRSGPIVRPIYAVLAAIDITDRKRTEVALAASMGQIKDYVERMTLALDAAKMASWYWDLTTEEITWSPYHETLWDYQPGMPDRCYEDWSRRVHADDLPRVEAAIQTAKETKTDFSAEYRVIWQDGTVHWVSGFGRFYFNDHGEEPYRMMGTVQEITDRKEIEASLELTEEQLRLATEAVDIGMWFWHLSDDRLVWTACCKRLFGLDPNLEITYDRFLSALHPDDRDRADATVRQSIKEKQEYEIEYRTVWNDQSIHWILAQGRTFYNDHDEPIRMMGIAQDITVRKQSEVALQEYTNELSRMNTQLRQTTALLDQRNQELDQYAHVVSHDLKAPLRTIANLSQWIEEDLQGTVPANIQEQMTLLRSHVYRMEAMITGLLHYARVDRTQDTTHSVDVGELLLEVVADLMPPPTFSVVFDANLPILYAKRLLLSQVFTNLIGNAINHHDRIDGSVQITATDHGDLYEFAVADDGPGIAQEYQNSIFTMFQTGSSKTKQDSTGIGLTIVKKVVETEGGTIRLASCVGKGTTFYFTWPKQS